ncbi:MAG: site-specific integrase [Bacteroidaceae bacterium]|nr:site-specific integrase [Bacteroidaceae bacterium]
MKKITYRPVFNRKKKLNVKGTALLQVEAYLEGRKIYFSTHIYLRPEQWDFKKQLIKEHPHAEVLNRMLREFIIQMELKELELWKNGFEVTLSKLKETFIHKQNTSFLQFVKSLIETSRQKLSTQRNRQSTYRWLMKFRPTVGFKEIDGKFICDFEKFLYNSGFQVNTVAKHMKHLKTFVNAAIDSGYIDSDNYAFKRYRIKTKETKHAFLIPEEVEKLEKLSRKGCSERLQHTLDAFLFCCYTGLRYSDFRNLSESNLLRIDGKPWIVFSSIKTDVEIKLPISLLFDGKGWKMLQKYKHDLTGFFAIKPNSNVNKELIRIRKLAKIDKHFSFHSARHTNATLLIYRGANITTVQKLLGHRDVSTTQIYSEVMERTLVKDLKKCATKNSKFDFPDDLVENG